MYLLQFLEDELLALQTSVKNEMKHSSSVKELFVGVQYRKAIIIATGKSMFPKEMNYQILAVPATFVWMTKLFDEFFFCVNWYLGSMYVIYRAYRY